MQGKRRSLMQWKRGKGNRSRSQSPAVSEDELLPESAAGSSSKADDTLTVGATVEARFGGGPRYFPGKVEAVAKDGSKCSIRYDDGDSEEGVKRLRARYPGQQQPRVGRGHGCCAGCSRHRCE